jgi:Mn2+/Fe2+ NRAMP family transporter
MVGPGLVVAAAGVGAGDMVSGLVAGANYGTTLIWAVVLGVIIKLCLTEGVGRWYMATGQTIVQGWQSLGRWATVYVMIYLVVLAFIYGAAVPSATALALTAMFPILSVPAWAIVVSVLSFVIVGLGRYGLFERVMEVLVIVMFVTIVGTAVLTAPNLLEVAGGLAPRLPEDSLLYALGVMGGVGATIGVTFYGYWVREKGWRDSSWIPMMRIDATVGYVMTGIFVLAMLVIGSQFLFATGASIEGEEGLVALSDPLAERFGAAARWLFLVGFFATTFSSVVGGWNGFAHLFADLARTLRGVPDEEAGEQLSEKGPYFRILLVWITFPPMFLLLFGQPVLLVVIYTALGAFFQPFLALTLLWLLNWRIARREFRNGWISNAVLAGTVALFVVLMAQEIVGLW